MNSKIIDQKRRNWGYIVWIIRNQSEKGQRN